MTFLPLTRSSCVLGGLQKRKKSELSTGCHAARLVDATGHKHMLIIIVGQQKRDVEVDHALPGAAWYCCRLLVLTPTGAATISFRQSLWELRVCFLLGHA